MSDSLVDTHSLPSILINRVHVRAGKADLDHSHHCEITTVLTAARVSRHASLRLEKFGDRFGDNSCGDLLG